MEADNTDDNAASKADEVFQTPELLEEILSNLSLYELFTVQRTCPTFRDTINGSIRLQRAMFLQPTPYRPPDQSWSRPNPFLMSTMFRPPMAARLEVVDHIACSGLFGPCFRFGVFVATQEASLEREVYNVGDDLLGSWRKMLVLGMSKSRKEHSRRWFLVCPSRAMA